MPISQPPSQHRGLPFCPACHLVVTALTLHDLLELTVESYVVKLSCTRRSRKLWNMLQRPWLACSTATRELAKRQLPERRRKRLHLFLQYISIIYYLSSLSVLFCINSGLQHNPLRPNKKPLFFEHPPNVYIYNNPLTVPPGIYNSYTD